LKLLRGDFREGDVISIDADEEGFMFDRTAKGEPCLPDGLASTTL
jgi:hypothetical protein